MSEEQNATERSMSGLFMGLVVVALLAALGSLVWCYGLRNQLGTEEQKLIATEKKNVELTEKLQATDARLVATTETLGQSVGIAQKQIKTRAQSILRAQQEIASRLEEEQAATKERLGAVSTDVASVKTDVAANRSSLETATTRLNRVVGDAGVMSGLIATNHTQLEELRRMGQRNYYEFTLKKGDKPLMISTIKIQLKKVDQKHSRYTMNVSADDHEIEKKDKNLDEPVQFYTGKTPVLYELVVNDIEKNVVSGYLSTPKGVRP